MGKILLVQSCEIKYIMLIANQKVDKETLKDYSILQNYLEKSAFHRRGRNSIATPGAQNGFGLSLASPSPLLPPLHGLIPM